ncbi:hypothetical protein BSPWISOX_2102 [uncultured Gammaproteobacteria bacterium]|nr:hypothetical protein BSPWISOX_2102 [uncultured Gammaproteobacteria bacterium]
MSSPPHRWLRNQIKNEPQQHDCSPPHRWLRKNYGISIEPETCSPPHRWLRNKQLDCSITKATFTTT